MGHQDRESRPTTGQMMLAAQRSSMAYTAAGIYAGAGLVGAFEYALPGGQDLSLLPCVAAIVIATLVALFGRHAPPWALAPLGPLGAAIIGYALATTPGPTDGASLYAWPMLWMSYHFGRRGTALMVAWVAIVHAAALLALPANQASTDRWLDVVTSVLVVAVVVRWLTERQERLVARLASEAQRDPLTHLLNRRGFDEAIAREAARGRRSGVSMAIVSFDIDHFKCVNDRHGHDVGDAVLRWVATLLERETRPVDIAARFGGEEFTVALPDADERAAWSFAERVRRAVAGERARGDDIPAEVAVTISAGVAEAAAPVDIQALLRSADAALYAAKSAGRNRSTAATAPSAVRP